MDLKKGNQKSSTTTSSPSSSSTMLDCVSVCDSPPHPAPNSSPVVDDFLTSTCVSSFPVFPRSLPRRSRKFSEENGNTLNLNFSKHPPAHKLTHTKSGKSNTTKQASSSSKLVLVSAPCKKGRRTTPRFSFSALRGSCSCFFLRRLCSCF